MCTKIQNELHSEVWNWKLFPQSSTDVLALLPRQPRGTDKNRLTKPTVYFILSLSRLNFEQII